MTTKLKDFKKLKQLDRIEYMLRYNRINEKYKFGFFFSLLNHIILITFLVFIIIITSYAAFGESVAITLIERLIWPYRLAGIFLAISILVDFYNVVANKSYKKQLYKEFFEVKTKK